MDEYGKMQSALLGAPYLELDGMGQRCWVWVLAAIIRAQLAVRGEHGAPQEIKHARTGSINSTPSIFIPPSCMSQSLHVDCNCERQAGILRS